MIIKGFRVARLKEFEQLCSENGLNIVAGITELKKPIKNKKISLSDGPGSAPTLSEKKKAHKNRDFLARALGLKKLIFPLIEVQADNVLVNPPKLIDNPKLMLKAFKFGDKLRENFANELGDAIALTDRKSNLKNGVAVHAADCGVLLIATKVNKGTIAAVHSGWKGTRLNITAKALGAVGADKDLANTCVYLGPIICGDCNEFGKELYKEEFKSQKNSAKWIKPHPSDNQKVVFDNRRAILDQMKNFGIKDENIIVDLRCTMEDPHFYSYRKDGSEMFSSFAVAIGFVE